MGTSTSSQNKNEEQTNDTRRSANVESVIGTMLRAGVVAAAVVIIAGLLLYLITGDSGYPGDTYPTDFAGIMEGLFALKSVAVIETGLLLLILTPVFRVFVSLFVFIIEKDFRFVWITTIVLIILVCSFLLGQVG